MSAKTPFQRRRDVVLQAMFENSAAIIAAAPVRQRNGDVQYAYRQNSNFYYLTGFNEPEAVLVLLPDARGAQSILFNRARSPEREIWDGPRAGQDGAVEHYHFHEAYPVDQLTQKLPEILHGLETIYFSFDAQSDLPQQILSWARATHSDQVDGSGASELVDLDPLLHEMRLFKEPEEIACLKKACQVTVSAHERAMRSAKPGMMEYQLEAEMTHEFMTQGCRDHAYSAIVGGGANGCILHYIDNNQPLQDGDLVLIDAGAEHQHYAADVTRTFPVNGSFSEPQKQIYQLVLDAQLAVIEMIKPGLVWTALQERAVRVIVAGLVELGLLQGEVDQLIESEAYKAFYMHGIGHWLGMDVHDVGAYKTAGRSRALEPGMVFTVEPGIYIAQSDQVDAKWWNMGIRIEDDVLVTEGGCEVLTQDLPKSVEDIETIMAGQ